MPRNTLAVVIKQKWEKPNAGCIMKSQSFRANVDTVN